MIPRMVFCTSAVRGSMKVSESASALATMIDFSSGVMYRWCGSLPVGIRLISRQLAGSITLMSASSEFRTKMGVRVGATASDWLGARDNEEAGACAAAVPPRARSIRADSQPRHSVENFTESILGVRQAQRWAADPFNARTAPAE